MQHCYGTVRFIIYNTDSKSSGYYSTVKSTFKSSVTTKTQPTYELINQFLETRSLVIAERPCDAQRQPNLNPNHRLILTQMTLTLLNVTLM